MNRKSFLRFLLPALMLAGMGCTFTACGDDDDDSLQGDLEVAELKALLLDAEGQIAFDATETKGLYQIGLESLEDAGDLISLYAGKNPHGENYTRELADKKGTVEVTTGLEGVFYQVSFAVDGIPPFALNLAEGSGGGNYLGIYHSCSVCGFKWISTLNRCPREGNDTYHPKKP